MNFSFPKSIFKFTFIFLLSTTFFFLKVTLAHAKQTSKAVDIELKDSCNSLYDKVIPLAKEDIFYLQSKGITAPSSFRCILYRNKNNNIILYGKFTAISVNSNDKKQEILFQKNFNLFYYGHNPKYKVFAQNQTVIFQEGEKNYQIPCETNSEAKKLYEQVKGIVNTTKKPYSSTKTPSLIQIAKNRGFTHLTHSTRPENLVAILKSQTIIPGKLQPNHFYGDPKGNHNAVFMSLQSLTKQPLNCYANAKKALTFTENRLPILIFSLDAILDKYEFHISHGYPYGKFNLYSSTLNRKDCSELIPSAHSLDCKEFAKFVQHPKVKIENEVVISSSIPLTHLKSILVKKGEKASIIQQLNHENILHPNHLHWEECIHEVEELHLFYSSSKPPFKKEVDQKLKQISHPGLTPYSKNSNAIISYALHSNKKTQEQLFSLLCKEYKEINVLHIKNNSLLLN